MIRIKFLVCVVLMLTSSVNANWTQFRGPGGQGHSDATDLPVKWSETKNVKWKTAIHDLGWSSPVVFGDQIWLTTATKDGKQMFVVCVDRNNGKILLDRKLHDNANPEPLGNSTNCYGSPTPVIEDGRVYIHFGSYGTTCINTKTFDQIWQRTDLPCLHYRGPGSSPIIFEKTLILTMDGIDHQYMVALDKTNGQEVWKKDRGTDFGDLQPDGKPRANGDFRKAYCTPIIVKVDGKLQMIIPSSKAAYAYDPRTGKEIWKVRYKGFSNASMTVYGGGLAFVNTGFGKPDLWAVKPNATGDITNSHVAWKLRRNVPKKPSPLLIGEHLFMCDDGGVASCVEAKTGKQVWTNRIGGRAAKYSSSPLYAGGHVYYGSEGGVTTVIKPNTKKFELVAENKLDAGFMASPAAVGKALYLRTKTHLYRIEK